MFQHPTGELSNGSGTRLFIGRTLMQDDSLRFRRALMQFDVANAVPDGATITGATLQMEVSKSISDDHDATLHRVLASWGESTSVANGPEGKGIAPGPGDATWLHREFPDVAWATPGGDFVQAPSATTPVARNGQYTWSSADIVSDIETWLANPDENFGWILLGNEVTNGSAKRFNSRENSDEATRPTLTIEYDEVVAVTPDASIADASIVEGDDGTNTIDFTVSLSEAANDEVSVDYTTVAGTAVGSEDYSPSTGTLTFAAGETSKVISIDIFGDTIDEPNEEFTLELSNESGLTLADAVATGVIEDNDDEPTLTLADASFQEGDATNSVSVTATLSHPSSWVVTADYSLDADTADATDFTPASGTLEFAIGETSATINIEILGDTVDESDESLSINLSNPTRAQLGNVSAAVSIINDDEPAGDFPWQNSELTQDVNGDGFVAAIDALQVINELNSQGIGIGPGELPGVGQFQPPPYLDVSGDGFLSPIDALQVINFINAQNGSAVAAVATVEVPSVEATAIQSRASLVDLALSQLWDEDGKRE